jgi:hypothetical protein
LIYRTPNTRITKPVTSGSTYPAKGSNDLQEAMREFAAAEQEIVSKHKRDKGTNEP